MRRNRKQTGATEEQLKKMEAAMGEYLKELTEDLPKFIQESEVDETALPELDNATVVQVSKENKEEREGADEKSDLILQKILLDLVSETVDQDMGIEAQTRLQEELDGMEFEAAHDMVKRSCIRIPSQKQKKAGCLHMKLRQER
ncbi:MAG: hypothetical protein ACLVG5_00915 [Clostridium sp.]